MHDEQVGNAAEPRHCFVVIDHQRLAAGVGTGHHQQQRLRLMAPVAPGRTAGSLVEQQPVQRCGGQQGAEFGQPGRDARQRIRRALAKRQQNDRCGGTCQQRLGLRIDTHHVAQRRRVGRHHRERLFVALLALAQPRHRLGLARIADELEAAQALERDDAASA